MREIASAERIERFLAAVAASTTDATTVYLTGGATAVLIGWRDTTRDIDLIIQPERDALLQTIARLRDELALCVDLTAPDRFIPVPPRWEERSPLVSHRGLLTVRHFDLTAQALAKIERGHTRDIADVHALLDAELVSADGLREAYDRAAPQLYRYPAIDPDTYRRALEAILSG
jgi:hypothetical protein